MKRSFKTVNVFVIYAHADERLRNRLGTFIKVLQLQSLIDAWYDRKINSGNQWQKEIDENLDKADLILILVSPDLLASDFCWNMEIKKALRRHKQRKAVVIPIFLRPCDTENIEFMKLQGLPSNSKPVTKWKNCDEAFTDISKGIRAVVERIRSQNGLYRNQTA